MNISDCCNNGSSLYEAMAARDGAFSEEFLQAVKAGDKSGGRVKPLHVFLKYRKLNDALDKDFGLDEG